MLSAGVGTVLRRIAGRSRYIWVYLLLLGVTEVSWRPSSPFLTLCAHTSLLFFLLLRAQFLTGAERELHITLAVVPAVRVISLSLPEWPILPLAQRVLVVVPLGVTALMTARALRFSLLGRWRPSMLASVPLELALGSLAGALLYALLRPAPLAPDAATYGGSSGVASLVLALIGLAFSEEIIFRGLLLGAATRLLGPARGILLAALAYASLLLGQGPWPLVPLFLAFGLACGWLAHASRSVFGSAVIHSTALVTLFLILPMVTQRSGG